MTIPFKRSFTLSLALVVALGGMALSTACSPDVVAVSVDAVVIASQTAVTWLGATNKLSPDQAQLLAGYVRSASVAAQQTITEWHSTDSGVVKATLIKGYWDAVVLPTLDKLPLDQAMLFSAIDTAVQEVLLEIAVKATPAQNVSSQQFVPSQQFVSASSVRPHKSSKVKARKLSKVQADAQAVQSKAEKILSK